MDSVLKLIYVKTDALETNVLNWAKSKNSKYIMSYFKNVSFYQAEMVTEKKNLFKNGHSWLARHRKHKIVPRLKISINLLICECQCI